MPGWVTLDENQMRQNREANERSFVEIQSAVRIRTKAVAERLEREQWQSKIQEVDQQGLVFEYEGQMSLRQYQFLTTEKNYMIRYEAQVYWKLAGKHDIELDIRHLEFEVTSI